MDRFSRACKDFGLTINLKKTQVMAQGIDLRPHVTVVNHELDVVHDLVYLGSAISNSPSLNTELQKRIGKASTTMARLVKRVWTNNKLSEHTKIQGYSTCVLSIAGQYRGTFLVPVPSVLCKKSIGTAVAVLLFLNF